MYIVVVAEYGLLWC